MIILPAIDLKGGKCVRLRQGREDDVTVYGDDPAAQAADWRRQGGARQSCPTLCDPIDGSPRVSPVTGILQARTLEWAAISFSNG